MPGGPWSIGNNGDCGDGKSRPGWKRGLGGMIPGGNMLPIGKPPRKPGIRNPPPPMPPPMSPGLAIGVPIGGGTVPRNVDGGVFGLTGTE